MGRLVELVQLGLRGITLNGCHFNRKCLFFDTFDMFEQIENHFELSKHCAIGGGGDTDYLENHIDAGIDDTI